MTEALLDEFEDLAQRFDWKKETQLFFTCRDEVGNLFMTKTKKDRNKKYNPRNKYADKTKLIGKLNEMMPVPDNYVTDIVLGLQLKIFAVKSAAQPFDAKGRETFRFLIEDAAAHITVGKKLSVLFADTQDFLDLIEESTSALATLVYCYRDQTEIKDKELDALDTLDLYVTTYRELLPQIRVDELKQALSAAAKELTKTK